MKILTRRLCVFSVMPTSRTLDFQWVIGAYFVTGLHSSPVTKPFLLEIQITVLQCLQLATQITWNIVSSPPYRSQCRSTAVQFKVCFFLAHFMYIVVPNIVPCHIWLQLWLIFTTLHTCRAIFPKRCEWVSSFLTAHQHILGYLVPYNDVEDMVKEIRYNQGETVWAMM